MTLWSKNAFISAGLLRHGTDGTQPATASMEEGLQLAGQEALFSAPKS